jgi:hypothetical protein
VSVGAFQTPWHARRGLADSARFLVMLPALLESGKPLHAGAALASEILRVCRSPGALA